MVTIYTDGSSRGNPGPGGYGALLLAGEHRKELSGGFARTTNNRMELMAAIAGLEALKKPSTVVLHSDSRYVVDAVNKGWVDSWKTRGWKKADKQPVKNRDLWERLQSAADGHAVTWKWVKGHAGHEHNECCDELATSAADGSDLPPDEGFVEELPEPELGI